MNKNISFIFGPNGAGKGTLARHLAEKYQYYHLNAGNSLRDWTERNARFDVLDQIDKGDFVADPILKEALEVKFEQVGHFLDILAEGVPRKLSQVALIQDLCKKYGYKPKFIMMLDVPLEILIDRVKDRVVAPDGHVYHMTLNPPPKHFKLSELHSRPDDAPEIVRKRFEQYMTHTLECISDPFFHDVQMISIDATKPIPEVYKIAEEFVNSINH